MKLLTYNIWFDSFYMEERISEISKIILDKDADFVALQEVTHESLLILHKYLDKKYIFSKNKLDKPYDDIILSQHKIIDQYYEEFVQTNMRREYHYIKVKIDSKIVKIVGIHLESDYKKDIKYRQLQYIFEKVKNENNIFIMGDTNIPQDITLPIGIKDAWIDYGKEIKTKYTYDYTKNSCINGKFTSRIDRVYMKNNWKVMKFELLGTEEIIKEVYPSDHF